jgi:hypothetical protein
VPKPVGEHLDLRPPALCGRTVDAALKTSLSDEFLEERDEIHLRRRPLRKLGRGQGRAVVAAGGALQITIGIRLGRNEVREEAGDSHIVSGQVLLDQKVAGGLVEQPVAFRIVVRQRRQGRDPAQWSSRIVGLGLEDAVIGGAGDGDYPTSICREVHS